MKYWPRHCTVNWWGDWIIRRLWRQRCKQAVLVRGWGWVWGWLTPPPPLHLTANHPQGVIVSRQPSDRSQSVLAVLRCRFISTTSETTLNWRHQDTDGAEGWEVSTETAVRFLVLYLSIINVGGIFKTYQAYCLVAYYERYFRIHFHKKPNYFNSTDMLINRLYLNVYIK